MKKLILLAAFAAALATPAFARAGDVTMRVQDVDLGGRSLASARPLIRFDMLGLHWTGPGSVSFRTHRVAGAWSAWQTADADEAPDGGTGSWHDGGLVWTGASNGVEYRTSGRVTRLRAFELSSRVTAPVRPRRLASATMPPIVTRAQWHADEDIVRAAPRYARTLKLAIVHHTAGTNTYSPAQAAAIVRGIEAYHVLGNGWNDIGYNFLIDRYGTIYEGRGGGIARNVIGAHAEGFNTGTVGVALIGNFTHAAPTKPMLDALVKLLAWRLDVAHVDPLSKVVYTSGGNYKFRAGRTVTLRAISGHRDTGPTECPGNVAYRLLPAIARRVAVTGLPKVYSPTVVGTLGGPIRFEARLSSSLPWTVTVTTVKGVVVARGSGTGTIVDWTWRSRRGGPFAWAIETPGALAASGTFGGPAPPPPPPPPPLTLTGLTVSPGVVSPAPGGVPATVTASFALSRAAQVTARVADATGAVVLGTPVAAKPAGTSTVSFDVAGLSNGRYTVTISAKPPGGTAATASAPLTVDRTLAGLTVAPAAFSPNGDGVEDTTALSFTLAATAPVRVDVEAGGVVVTTLFAGPLPAGPHTVPWDGTAAGATLPDGAYTFVVTVTDALGNVQFPAAVTIDTQPPQLTLLDPHLLQFTLDEPATVTLTVNNSVQLVEQEPAGTFTIPFTGSVYAVTAQARDAAGNVSAVVTA